MQEIRIPLSKKKIFFYLFSVIISSPLIFYLIIDHPSLIVKIVAAMVIPFVIFAIIYLFMKLFDKKPGLIINDQGIVDNSSAIKAGLIKWEDITDVSITEMDISTSYGNHKEKLLTIKINNPDDFLSKQNRFKRIFMELNKNFYDSPIQISCRSLKCNLEDLYDLIKREWFIHRESK